MCSLLDAVKRLHSQGPHWLGRRGTGGKKKVLYALELEGWEVWGNRKAILKTMFEETTTEHHAIKIVLADPPSFLV